MKILLSKFSDIKKKIEIKKQVLISLWFQIPQNAKYLYDEQQAFVPKAIAVIQKQLQS